MLAAGETQQRWKDFDVFAYERMGGPHLLVALNNDPAGPQTIHVDTGFGPNVALHDYTGHVADVRTDGTGAVTLTVPRNLNGQGYVCYSRQGQDRALCRRLSHGVTQDFEGAADLDILPCTNGETVVAGRIWCAAGSPIRATLTLDRAGWNAASKVDLASCWRPTKLGRRSSRSPPGARRARSWKRQLMPQAFIRFAAGRGRPSGGQPRTALQDHRQLHRAATISKPEKIVTGRGDKTRATWAMVRRRSTWRMSRSTRICCRQARFCTGVAARNLAPSSSRRSMITPVQTYMLDPATGVSRQTKNQPTLKDGTPVNLFCSGHTFLPDGRLMVVGGHLFDSQGVNQSCIYDPATDTWTPKP